MPKYIDADDFYVSQVARCWADPLVGDGTGSSARLYDELQRHPAADVQEVKHAIWFRNPAKHNCWCCSHCGKFAMSDCHMWILTNYCPHCGAKMED